MTKKFACLLLCFVIITSFIGCSNNSDNVPASSTATIIPVEENLALKKFENAASRLNDEKMLKQDIKIKTTKTIGAESFTKSIERTAEYLNKGSDDMFVHINDSTVFESQVIISEEIYSNGKIYYFEEDESDTFVSDMNVDDFISRSIPSVILDAKLYNSVSFDGDNQSKILFKDATAVEKWLAPEYSKISSAQAEAEINSDGNISKFKYIVSYTQGGAKISAEYDISISKSEESISETDIPKYEDCIKLEDINILKLLIDAYYSMNSATYLTASDYTTLQSQAIGVYYSYNQKMYSYGNVKDYKGKIETEYTYLDSKNNIQNSSVELFKDGKYTFTKKGESPVENDVDSEIFLNYIIDNFISHIHHPSIITNPKMTTTDDFYIINYDAKDLGADYEDIASYKISQDYDYIDKYATEYNTTKLNGFIYIDKDTLCPVSVGVDYEGYHIINNQKYLLMMTVDQSINIGNISAYYEITGEYLPEEKPEKSATPLFYEVTSPNGGKAYLLGTIHLGDEKTAYLPQKIYDAFNESDALAVEVDVCELTELLKKGEYGDLILSGNTYSDGTKISDHIDKDLYNKGLTLLHATGMPISVLDIYLPSFWASAIDDLYNDYSHSLYSYKGVDERLLRLAKDAEKEIISIEKYEDSLLRNKKYPDNTQELILNQTLKYSKIEFINETNRLYEMWCSGDEAKLKAEIRKNELSDDATKEDLAAYEEYKKIIETERDKVMLDAVKGYVDSDKTVFVAVGLAHVLGETGLVDALNAAGYTVTRVQY